MNIEEKAKAYDEALERAKNLISRCKSNRDRRTMIYRIEDIEHIFPELNGSDDEKVREALIALLNFGLEDGSAIAPGFNETKEQALSWLEKQGKQETLCDKCRKEQPSHSCQDITALGRCAVEHEQKPTDIVEPKFKIDDWIVQENIGVYKVIEVCESWYEVIDVEDNHYSIGFDKEYMCHLWTIKDAKPGDILVCDADKRPFIFKGLLDSNHPNYPVAYCGIDSENLFHISTGDYWWTDDNVKPATKEQSDLLFKKMEEVGYTFDFEKKELKEFNPDNLIEESYQQQADDLIDMVTEKPTWSEEDEERFRSCICILLAKGLMGDTETINTKWLKSIKERLKGK